MNVNTNPLTSLQIGQTVDYMMNRSRDQRVSFERKWYDNNFFDDGYHFRYMQRSQNKIVDLSQGSTIWNPMRSIPKSSRQIRGVANLLASRNFVPIIYPEPISSAQFPPQVDPSTGQKLPNPEYKQAVDEAKRLAKNVSHYIKTEWKNQDLTEKLAFMIILTAKHGISYLQIWPDSVKEAIRSQVYDAFDIYLLGNYTELEAVPYIIKAKPRLVSEIKADERYSSEDTAKINPDNRFASSEIKEAYEKARHGGIGNPDEAASVIEKEAFIKEYLDSDNKSRITQQPNGGDILRGKKDGDMVMRHTYVAGNITLKDEYVNLPGYPFVDLRFEPGPLYQTPMIERFIPSNKSLDLVVSRVERYLHTMVTGSWSVKSGEPAEPTNTAGGQIFNYNTTPPVQNQVAGIPQFVFSFMGLLESFIEEQGVTTTALGKIPKGVRAHAAIESLKESEFANLSIASNRLQNVVGKVTEKILDHVDNYFVTPQTVYYLDKGEPAYFDIIGASAIEKRAAININTPSDVVPIKKDYRVDIQVESGLAYTQAGKKEAARELGDFLVQIAPLGLVSPEVVKVYFRSLLENFGFGATEDIMEAMDQFEAQGMMDQKQLDQMKMALAEVLKDVSGSEILPDSKMRIEETQVGVAQAIKDTGLVDNKGEANGESKPPARSISFKDLPPEGKVQLAEQAGIQLDEEEIKKGEMLDKVIEMDKTNRELKIKEQKAKGDNNANN